MKNQKLREDLYEKMVKQDPSEPTEQENIDKAVTKLRYMTVSYLLTNLQDCEYLHIGYSSLGCRILTRNFYQRVDSRVERCGTQITIDWGWNH